MNIIREKICEADFSGFSVSYSLTMRRLPQELGGVTRYGVRLEKSDGDYSEFTDVFGKRGEALDFIEQLCRCEVTPTTLEDIVYDRLCST